MYQPVHVVRFRRGARPPPLLAPVPEHGLPERLLQHLVGAAQRPQGAAGAPHVGLVLPVVRVLHVRRHRGRVARRRARLVLLVLLVGVRGGGAVLLLLEHLERRLPGGGGLEGGVHAGGLALRHGQFLVFDAQAFDLDGRETGISCGSDLDLGD